ncbi:MAG: TIGR00289 family protein [Candidatus Bathyarchaeia archaeon]
MRLAALITGGKDSALALHRVLKEGHEVAYLVTMIPQREDSWMYHFPNIRLTDLFAEASGIPLVKAETSGVKEEEVEDMKRLLAELDVDGIVSGAVYSEYQKSRIDRVCREIGKKSVSPLWHENPSRLMIELIDFRFEVVIVGVYAYGLDQNWLGRQIDRSALEELVELEKRYQISVIGEGGEFETFVLYAPYFKKRIHIVGTEVIWENGSGYLSIKGAELA